MRLTAEDLRLLDPEAYEVLEEAVWRCAQEMVESGSLPSGISVEEAAGSIFRLYNAGLVEYVSLRDGAGMVVTVPELLEAWMRSGEVLS